MRSRTRPLRSGITQLDIRMRRMARRARVELRPSPDSAPNSTPESRPPSADIGAERELIVTRIAELKAELAEQERHLQAIDLLLGADPSSPTQVSRMTASHRRSADILDVEYTVVR